MPPVVEEQRMDKPDIVERAEEMIDEHTEPDGERKYADAGDGVDPTALRREQQDEAAHAWVGPGVPAMTGGQWHGLAMGAVVGAAVGALLFLPLALIPFMGPVGLRILLVVAAGALAGGTAGALYAGGREPELEGETIDADGRPSVGTTPRDPHTDARGR
jgi:hypothetical protein